jgi:outer membrane protein OmpA-like peptidoglycan-associated protein
MVAFSLKSQETTIPTPIETPTIVLKSNLLYDLTSTINLGAEFRLSDRFTLDVPFNYNPWTFSGNKKIKHLGVQPELRYWLKQSFGGSFLGVHAHVATYNWSRVFTDYQYEGWLIGGGLSYGYRWNLGSRWGLEASVGVGYARLNYDKYAAPKEDCITCGERLKSSGRNYFGPTKVALSLVYTIGKKRPKAVFPPSFPLPAPEPMDVMPPTVTKRVDTVAVVVKRDTVFVQPPKEPVYRQESGSAYVQFPVNSARLLSAYGQNELELRKIEQSVHKVRQTPNSEIKRIVIEAYSSPEGNEVQNVGLAERRSVALKQYMIETYALDPTLFETRSGGENWQGLSDAILFSEALTDNEKDDLAIILEMENTAVRKAQLKAYKQGTVYARLLRTVYPTLRMSAYRIDYIAPEN